MIKKYKLIGLAAVVAFFLLLSCKNNLLTKTEKEKLGDIPVKSIRILPNENELSLVKNTTKNITVQIIPEKATNKTLIYSSKHGDIASIDNTGLITAKKEGRATITIETSNGIKKTIDVIVTPEAIPVTGISLIPNEDTISLINGTDRKIEAHVIPKNASNKKLTFSLDNQETASITEDGKITAKAVGSANITIKAADGISKTVKLIVTAASIRVTSIEFEEQPANPVELVIGESYELKLKVMPENATNKELRITSSDDDTALPTEDGNRWIKAKKEGQATITITSEDNSSVKKEVHFNIKPLPSIELITEEITSESIESNLNLEIKTLHGKLSYTPKIVGEESSWLTVVRVDNTTSTGKDTIYLKAAQNKTVWKRTAYINFMDGSNKEIKNANGEKLEVKVVQKENKNPTVRIQWVHGIGEPTAAEKERGKIEIPRTNPVEYWDNSYIFFWYETTETKWFNTRKVSLLEIPAPEGADGNQCWAKTASNMLHWWFEQNQTNIDRYLQNKTEAEKAEYEHYYKRDLSTEEEKEKSYIANTFRLKAHNNKQGDFIISGLGWYLYGGNPGISRKDKPAFEGPALFKDVFSKDEGKTPIEVKRVYNRASFNDAITGAIQSKKAIGITLEGSKGTNGYAHGITLWGAVFDEEGNIIAIYVVDNNFTPNRVFPYGIYYKEGLPYLFNYPNNAPVSNKYVGEVTTLDKGEELWQEWFRTHP